MSPLGPYRAPAGDAATLGWIEAREASTTTFVRHHGSSFAAAAAVLPLLFFARVLLRSLGALSIFGWAVAIAFALGVIAFWPLARERLQIDARGLVWRDRVAASRCRIALARLELRTADAPVGKTVSLGDGRDWYLVARGEASAIDALAASLDAAIVRARAANDSAR